MRLPLRQATRSNDRARLIAELRRAIDCLPEATREAMLVGVRARQPIIAGAYTDSEGGVCPMLAAHRRGGRTDLLAFARAWDRFTGTERRARRATRREIGVLVAHLEASLLQDAAPELGRAISEHRKSVELRRWRAARGERERRREAASASPPPHHPLSWRARVRVEALDPRGPIRARRLRRRGELAGASAAAPSRSAAVGR